MDTQQRSATAIALKALQRQGFRVDQMRTDEQGRMVLTLRFRKPTARPNREPKPQTQSRF